MTFPKDIGNIFWTGRLKWLCICGVQIELCDKESDVEDCYGVS